MFKRIFVNNNICVKKSDCKKIVSFIKIAISILLVLSQFMETCLFLKKKLKLFWLSTLMDSMLVGISIFADEVL